MSLFHAVALGIVQGLTEFLPVSSSSHPTLIPVFFGWEDPGLAFDVSLHLGTLAGVLAYFWNDLWKIAKSQDRNRWALLLITGSLPGAIVGYAFRHQAETTFRSPLLIACTLIGAGMLLAWADRERGDRPLNDFTLRDALFVGIAQSFAVVPGISRSAITISTALFLKFDRPSAARFSFLLSIPIIAGAGLLEGRKILHTTLPLSFIAWGFAASCVSGFIAIYVMLRLVQTKSYISFVVYRILLGGAFLLWLARII